MDFGIRNDKPYSHTSRHRTKFKSDRCDFQNGVTMWIPAGMKPENLIADVSEFIGFHAANILPELNGFQGYDNISYTILVRE